MSEAQGIDSEERESPSKPEKRRAENREGSGPSAVGSVDDGVPIDGVEEGAGKDEPTDEQSTGERLGSAGLDAGALSLLSSIALAIASGLLYFLAFPGIDVWPAAFIALAPLIIALRGQTPGRGLLLGWVAGFTMTMTGFYWLFPCCASSAVSGRPSACSSWQPCAHTRRGASRCWDGFILEPNAGDGPRRPSSPLRS